jgi:ABC-type arginine transport system ATPase subunit
LYQAVAPTGESANLVVYDKNNKIIIELSSGVGFMFINYKYYRNITSDSNLVQKRYE